LVEDLVGDPDQYAFQLFEVLPVNFGVLLLALRDHQEVSDRNFFAKVEKEAVNCVDNNLVWLH
jgi:hypothetical protein